MPSRSITRREAWFAGHGEGDDLIEPEPAEPVIDCGARGFGGIPLAPMSARQSPRRFDRRRER